MQFQHFTISWLLIAVAGTADAQLPPVPPVPPPMFRAAAARVISDDVRDSVDSRAPEDRRASQMLSRAEENIRREEWATAIQQLQSILNEPNDGLVRLGPGRFVSMRTAANKLLSKMPRDWRKRYAQQYGAAAKKSLEEALRKGDYRAVGDVATRYLQTDAGGKAARALALRHFDRGEYGMALHWFEVFRTTGRRLDSPAQQLQLAATEKLAGSPVTKLPESLVLNGQSVRATDLLTDLRSGREGPAGQTDWPMLMGSPNRLAVVPGKLPLLVETWNQSLLQSDSESERVRDVVRGALDSSSGLIPAGLPLVVGSRVACRTIEGVSVFDTRAGELLWRTNREDSTRDLLSQPARTRFRSGEAADEKVRDFYFRDSVHGLLSSDGQRLFVIEHQAMPNRAFSQSRFRNARSDKLIVENATNVLAAYDLETGGLLWSVGGVDSGEQFKPVLAGHYFHGVPVAVGGELFIVTENDNAIRLQTLDPTTGEVKWSQLLAFSAERVERAFDRRSFTAQITVAGGVLLCPTTADWLIAVNPLTRGIAWARRHPQRGNLAPRERRSFTPLGAQWPASAPVVVGNRVIFTPPESDHIEGLNLTTGEQVWLLKKGTTQYMVGAFGKAAVFVARDRAVAVQAANGRAIWTHSFDDDDFPAGRGVLSSEFLHQPMTSGRILSIDLQTGEVAHQTGRLRSEPLVANLVVHGGGTLLQTPTSLESYQLRPDSGAAVPKTAIGKLRAAEVMFADGKLDESIATVEDIDLTELDDRNAERRVALLRTALSTRIRTGATTAAADIDRLAEIVNDDATITRLRIGYQTATKDFAGAFRELLKIFASQVRTRVRIDDRSVVDRDQWLAGQLSGIWEQMDEQTRESVHEDVLRFAMDEEFRQRFSRVFAFHPAATEILHEELNSLLSAKRFCEAEEILRNFRRFAPNDTVTVCFKYAKALAASGQIADAVSLLHEFGAVGKVAELPVPEFSLDRREEWKLATWSKSQFAGRSSAPLFVPVPVYRGDVQFHRDYVCVASLQPPRRLNFYSLKHERIDWSLPLRLPIRGIMPNGRSLVVVHDSVLVCIAPLEKRVLWELPIAPALQRPPTLFTRLRSVDLIEQPTLSAGSSHPVAILNEDYVCLREQRSITVYDAVSGEFRWSNSDLQRGDSVTGTVDAVFVLDSGGNQRALKASNGLPIPGARIKNPGRTYAAAGPFVLSISEQDSPRKSLQIQLHDPVADQVAWSMDFEADSRVAVTGSREITVLEGRNLTIVDVIAGTKTSVATTIDLARKEHRDVAVATTPTKVFLIAQESWTAGRGGEQFLDGTLSVLSRGTGTELWKRDVAFGSLVPTFFRSLPVLLLGENGKTLENGIGRVRDFHLVNPDTGEQLAGQRLASQFNSAFSVRFEPARNFIEVVLETRRIRFTADRGQSETESVED